MADPLRHRQTNGAATDMVDLTPPRHFPTLPLRGTAFAGRRRPVQAVGAPSRLQLDPKQS